jgi:hypothetical protein
VIVFSDVNRSLFGIQRNIASHSGSKRPRSVTIGIELTEGDTVIIEGSSLLQSYSRLKSAVRLGYVRSLHDIFSIIYEVENG